MRCYNSKTLHVQIVVTLNVTEALLNFFIVMFNPLNAELNPICYLLALLAHHFLHVSRIRVKSLMSYIYIHIYIYIYIYVCVCDISSLRVQGK